MNKIKETFGVAYKALRYSFAFCLRNNKKDTVIVSILLIAQALLGYAMIVLMGQLISTIQQSITQRGTPLTASDFIRGEYFIPSLLFIAALFIEIILQKFRSFFSGKQRQTLRLANNREMNDLRASLDIARIRSKAFDDLEKKIEELPESWFTRMSFAGEMINLLGALCGLMVFGVTLLTSHPNYVLILIASSVPMIFAEFTAVGRLWKFSLEMIPHHKKRGVLTRAFHGSITFLQAKMFNQMPPLSQEIKENHNYLIEATNALRWQNLQITLLAYVIAMGGLSIVLFHSVWNTLTIGGDLGVLTVVIGSSRRLQSAIREMVLQVATQWQSAKGMILIEEEYFGSKPLLKTVNPVIPEFRGPPTIRLENVSFGYPEQDSLVLKNINLTIEPCTKVAIVGKSGSGKSSLISLLLRHYDPTSGTIHAGDINLQSINPSVWSKHACALLQDFVVLPRTIGNEIASSKLGEPSDMEIVQESVKFAEFATVVDADPNGLNSQIGTEFDGREFSGGELQRLALARAKYSRSPIFILDEPDGKLDAETAEKIINNIFAMKNTTVIIVTHHVARAMRSDKILVLDGGELVESGTHEELLCKNGKYASMLKKDKVRLNIE